MPRVKGDKVKRYWQQYRQGMTLEAIADQAGVKSSSVRKALLVAGYKLPDPRKLRINRRLRRGQFLLGDRQRNAINAFGKGRIMEGVRLLAAQIERSPLPPEPPEPPEPLVQTEFYLNKGEMAEVRSLAQKLGLSESAVFRHAIEALIAQHNLSQFRSTEV